jgi:hypothetical protein
MNSFQLISRFAKHKKVFSLIRQLASDCRGRKKNISILCSGCCVFLLYYSIHNCFAFLFSFFLIIMCWCVLSMCAVLLCTIVFLFWWRREKVRERENCISSTHIVMLIVFVMEISSERVYAAHMLPDDVKRKCFCFEGFRLEK